MELRVLLLADINSAHTQKWALGLAADKINIGIFSFTVPDSDWYRDSPYITCLSTQSWSNGIFGKAGYLLRLPALMDAIEEFRPDILHAHYASSYGLLGALTSFRPFLVSAWGSDVIEFPKKGPLQRIVLKFVFKRANRICATSAIMKCEIGKYTDKPCLVVPFGVDLTTFYSSDSNTADRSFIFGCIKHFEKIYNIDKVVIAFSLLVRKYPHRALKLKLVGAGSQKSSIQKLTGALRLEDKVEMTGKIKHSEVPSFLNTFNALVNVSEFESFGVAVAEAMACKVPVIVSSFEGFKDLVPDGENAIIAESTSPEGIFRAMEECFLNGERRATAVKRSYELILRKFNWPDNLKQMERVYYEFMPSGISSTTVAQL